jgi:hypothetical protein
MTQIKTESKDVRKHGKKLTGIRLSRRHAQYLLVGAFFAAAAIVLAIQGLDRSSAADTISAGTSAESFGGKAILASPQETIRTERVTAFRHGFEPKAITRPEGLFLLCVDNRAGTEALSLQLTSGTSGPVYASPIKKGIGGTNKELSLQPGVYMLTEASHPGWICTITITAK